MAGMGPPLSTVSPIPKRTPQEGFNAKADLQNPTNRPTMDMAGKLSYPWLKAAPGFVGGTAQVQNVNPDVNAGFANMTRWGPYTPDMQNPGWEPSDPALKKQFRDQGGWGK